jgi:hypothetical protein
MRKQIIRIKLKVGSPSKLQLVRLIKECSELGLRESKDICDRLHSYPDVVQTFEARQDNTGINYAKKFREEIKNCGGEFIVSGGTELMREFKMLELGIGDNQDYADFIVDYYENGFELTLNNINYRNKTDFLKFVVSKLKREELISIFEKAKETYKDYI